MLNKKKIILVFNEYQIKKSLRLKEKDPNIILVPWSIRAYDYLYNNRIKFYDISYDFNEQHKLNKSEWHAFLIKYKQWCQEIDRIISNEIIAVNKINLKVFESLFIELRGIFYTSHEETKKIFFLISKKNIENISYFESKHIKNLTYSILLNYSDVFPEKIIQIKNEGNLSLNNYGYLNDSWLSISTMNEYDISNNSLVKIIKNYFKQNIKYFFGLVESYKTWREIYFAINPSKINKKTIFIYDSLGPDFNLIIKKLRSMKDYQILFREDLLNNNTIDVNFSLDSIEEKLINSKIFRDKCLFNDADLSQIFLRSIRQILDENLYRLFQNAVFFINLNKIINIKLVLTSHQNAYCEFCFLYSDHLNIPNITIQHGFTSGFSNLGPPTPEYMRKGSENYNYFVFSKLIANFQEGQKKVFNSNLNLHATGSPSSFKYLSKNLKRTRKDNKINLCFVFGDINSDKKFNRGRYSDHIQYELVANLIDKFSNVKNFHFHIKCGYNIEFEIPFLISKARRSSNISIIPSKVSLMNKINKMDLFVLNNLSTPLKEITATDIPLLIYRYPTSSNETVIFNDLIEKRATIVNTSIELNKHLDELILRGKKSQLLSSLLSTNKEFFHSFCLVRDTDPTLAISSTIHNLLNKNRSI